MKFEYREFFPHPTVRSEQDISVAFVLDAFLNQGKKYVVLELGTGCGKSAIGVTVGRYLTNLRKDREDEDYLSGAYTLTTQKVLQEQYINDFGAPPGRMASIKSASNFQCEFYKGNTCGESLRILRSEKSGTPFWKKCTFDCCYKREKKAFLESPESITNYSYMLAETMYGGKITPRDLLVLDEGHNVESELSKFIEVIVSEKFAKDVLKLEWPKVTSDKATARWIRETYNPTLTQYITRVKEMLEKFKLEEKIKEFVGIAKQHEMLDKHSCKIHRFLEMYTEDNWVMNVLEADGRSLRKFEFKPVDVGPYSEELLFRFGKHVILMSATIVNRDVFCSQLGIPLGEVAFLSLDSPFPIENRPIFYAPAGSMARSSIDKTLPKMAEMVKFILEQHKGEKGIIHTHTFKIAKFIKKNVKSRRLIIHDSSNREEMVKKHMESDKGTVLISPSLAEGIDLKDDLSRFQIICKIPFPYLGDKLVKKRMARNRLWYPYQTAKTIVQAAGRSVRSQNDHAVTYILDANWDMFFSRNSNMLPESFKRALQG